MIKIGLVDIVPPSSLKIDFEDIEDNQSSLRMADGRYMRDIIATKRTLSLEWDALKWSEVSVILSALNHPFIEVTYPDSISGTLETREFYVSRRGTPVAFMQEDENGIDTYYWEGVSVVLEER